MMHKVFVYGTLKSREPNNNLLNTSCPGHAKFIGSAVTTQKYPLIIGTKYNIPFLLYAPNIGNIVQGEVYEVDDKTLEKLDELEGHPDYYVREIETFILKDSNASECKLDCWIYFLKDFPEAALKKTFYSNYSSYGDHNLPYMERSRRDPSHNNVNTKYLLFDELK